MLVYSFPGKAADEFPDISCGQLVYADMTYRLIDTFGQLALSGVCSAFQIQIRILLEPVLRQHLKFDRRSDLTMTALLLKQYRLPCNRRIP